jgi:VCBS repeat-containing protein
MHPFSQAGRKATGFVYLSILGVLAGTLAACGGGGGDEGDSSDNPTPAPAPNQAPTLNAQGFTGDEDADISGAVVATDPENGALTFSRTSDPAQGAVTQFSANGSFTYRPNGNANGTDSFQVRVTDGGGLSATSTVTITIRPVNDAPSAADDVIAAANGPIVTLDVLGNDADIDGDSLQVEVVQEPSVGQATVNADGSIALNVGTGFTGFSRLTYRVTDAGNASREARALVFVNTQPQKLVLKAQPTQADSLGQLYTHDLLDATPVSGATDVCGIDSFRIRPSTDGSAILYSRCDAAGSPVRELEVAALEGPASVRSTGVLAGGAIFVRWAISADGRHIAWEERIPAGGTPEVCRVHLAVVAQLPLSDIVYTADAGTGLCPNKLEFGRAGAFFYLGVVSSDLAGGAYLRRAVTGNAFEEVFGSLNPAQSRRFIDCQTSRDEAQHFCTGGAGPGATADDFIHINAAGIERVVNPPLGGELRYLGSPVVNRQFTHAVFDFGHDSDPLKQRLFVVDLSSTDPALEIFSPSLPTGRSFYLPLNFSLDGETVMVQEFFVDGTRTYLTTNEARLANNWQVNRLFPAFGQQHSTGQPRVAPDNETVFMVNRPASGTDVSRHFLRMPIDDPSQAAPFGNTTGALNASAGLNSEIFAVQISLMGSISYAIMNSSTPEGQLDIAAPAPLFWSSTPSSWVPQPTR